MIIVHDYIYARMSTIRSMWMLHNLFSPLANATATLSIDVHNFPLYYSLVYVYGCSINYNIIILLVQWNGNL